MKADAGVALSTGPTAAARHIERHRHRDALVSFVPSSPSEADPFPGSLLSQMSALASPGTFIWSRLADELRAKRAASSQGFVAMWFTDEMEAVYENGLEPGIRRAGFSPMLIRNKEHANKIDDEIIAEIAGYRGPRPSIA
jgi:hypothetical protein